MKILSKTLTTILLFVLSTSNIYSQFIPAGIAQLAFGITGNVRQTGNDLMDYGMDQIKVSVFDGGNGSAQLAYQVNNGTVGFVNLGSTAAIDPDVVLIVDDNGDLHALVAYYEGTNNAHKLDEFDYSSGVFTHNQTITLNSSTTLNFGTAINIDADDSYNFAVIWDDLGTSKLYVFKPKCTFHSINLI